MSTAQLQEDVKTQEDRIDQRWVKISNDFYERVSSLMTQIWTNEQNQMLEDFCQRRPANDSEIQNYLWRVL